MKEDLKHFDTKQIDVKHLKSLLTSRHEIQIVKRIMELMKSRKSFFPWTEQQKQKLEELSEC